MSKLNTRIEVTLEYKDNKLIKTIIVDDYCGFVAMDIAIENIREMYESDGMSIRFPNSRIYFSYREIDVRDFVTSVVIVK